MGAAQKTVSAIFVGIVVSIMLTVYHFYIFLPTFSEYEKKFYVIDFQQISAVRALDTIAKQSRGELVITGAADMAKLAEEFREDFLKAIYAEVGNTPVFAKSTVISAENFEDLTFVVAERLGLVINEEKLKEFLFISTANQQGLTNIQFPDKLIDPEVMNIFETGPDGKLTISDSYLIREFGTTDLSSPPYKDTNSLNFEKFE